jgi:hypothetical protein
MSQNEVGYRVLARTGAAVKADYRRVTHAKIS